MRDEVGSGQVHGSRARGEDIRNYILENISHNAKDITSKTSQKFGITKQAVNKHLTKLVAQKELIATGSTRNKTYSLAILGEFRKTYKITSSLEEHVVWSKDISVALGPLPKNVMDIWHFCVTEMVNNAVDHSGGTELVDNGVGIFRKIQKALDLVDERHSVLELAKGKLTTDPANHTGQGIFFSSRLVDSFEILSGGVFFMHDFGKEDDWILEVPETNGTAVLMKLSNHSPRIDKQIFDQYSSGEDYGFTKTVVPVRLAQYGEDRLVSRSQAKRLLSRVDLFQTVIFDFQEVEAIGQAFADEIFRVFARNHPKVEVIPTNTSTQVQQMITSARAQWAKDVGGI